MASQSAIGRFVDEVMRQADVLCEASLIDSHTLRDLQPEPEETYLRKHWRPQDGNRARMEATIDAAIHCGADPGVIDLSKFGDTTTRVDDALAALPGVATLHQKAM